MPTDDERASLSEEPLPVVIVDDDKRLPTRLYEIDRELEKATELVAKLQEDRKSVIDRIITVSAKRPDLLENATHKVMVITKEPPQKINMEILKTRFHAEYEQIRQNKLMAVQSIAEESLRKAIAKANDNFSQDDVKAVIPDKGRFVQLLYRPGTPQISYTAMEKVR